MSSSEVRQRCRGRLGELQRRGLEIPQPFDVAELVERVSRCLRQPVKVVGIPMPAGAPYGLTLFTADSEHIIAHEAGTSRVHRDHIVVHELAHIILEHRPIQLDDPDATQQVLPHLSPNLVLRVLARSGAYSRTEEEEAETMATMLLQHAGRAGDDVTLEGLSPEEVAFCHRVAQCFEKPR